MLLEVKVLCNFSLFLFWLFSHMNIYACKEDISCRNKGVFKTYVEWDYAAFSSSCASSFAILRPCFRTVAFSFLMSSKSSSIFKPSGRAAASTPFPFVDTCEIGLDVFAEELRIVEILVLDLTKSLSVEPSPESAVICIIIGFLSLPENHSSAESAGVDDIQGG